MGWALVFEGRSLRDGQDVMRWSEDGWRDPPSTWVQLPVGRSPTIFPTDFRSPVEVRQEAVANEAFLLHNETGRVENRTRCCGISNVQR